MKRIKAIIFDMDGVLIDAKEWHYLSLNKALSLFGYEISMYDHLVTYDGLPTLKKLELLTKERGLPIMMHNFINILKQKYTMEMIQTKCKPYFYHEYALSKLKNEGYRLAVASNSIRQTVDVMMDKSCLKDYIEFSLSNQDVKKGKPDPEIYISAITRLNLAPSECLIVEDNENGIRAAKASGSFIMQVNGVEEVNYSNIKRIINSIEEA